MMFILERLETYGQIACSVGRPARSQGMGVLGRETTHPFHGGHRRHDDVYIGAIGDLRSNCVLGQETGTITGDGCARSGDYPSISWWAQAAQSGVYGQETTHPFHGGHRRHNRENIMIVPASSPSTGFDH